MKKGIAGSLSSCDCYCVATESNHPTIQIDSVVDAFFHEQILQAITQAIQESNHLNVDIHLIDKGAFDYTIQARVLCAIARCFE
ncbi:MAG: hypothetical protein U1C51_07675 [Candidatus Izemoplasmatales bacterium]|nr:hypothetical protein [bacterium]MDZ4197100.1 hypothetical protein [Candidatus Izemoplasmatales bacterium]